MALIPILQSLAPLKNNYNVKNKLKAKNFFRLRFLEYSFQKNLSMKSIAFNKLFLDSVK